MTEINYVSGKGLKTYDENIKKYIDAAEISSKKYVDDSIAFIVENNTDTVDSIKELVSAMTNNSGAIESLVDISENKADKASSLSGYGIEDAYTATEIDSLISDLNTSISGKAPSDHGHLYAGSTTDGGSATHALSAEKLDCNSGATNRPVYFAHGYPQPCEHTLSKSVPSDAKFTDTTYTSLKNPYGLILQNNGTNIYTYTGEVAKYLNFKNGENTEIIVEADGSVTVNSSYRDTTVQQVITNSNASYPLLLAPSGQSANAVTTTCFDSGVTLNPSTNTITANITGNAATSTKVNGTLTIDVGGDGNTASHKLDYDGSKAISISVANKDHDHDVATTSANGFMSANMVTKLNGIASGANAYTLPAATSAALGGVIVGSNISNSNGTISLTKANVTSALGYTPPTTDTNTTYALSTGTANGKIKVVPSSGSPYEVSVCGLGSAAYTASTAYATAAQGTLASNAMPKSGGTFTSAVTFNGHTHFKASCYMPNNVFYNSYNADGTDCCILGVNGTNQLQLGSSGDNPHLAGTVIISKNSEIKFKNSASYANSDGRSIEYSGSYFRPTVDNTISLGTSSLAWYQVATERLYVYSGKPTFAYIGSDGAGTTVSSAANMYVNASGVVSRYTKESSKTIKHDIKGLEDETIRAERLYDLPVHQAKYNADVLDKDDDRYLKDLPMFIIEEMNEVYPVAVDRPDNNVRNWSWNSHYMIPPMLKLIQDQKKQIDNLEERLLKLES